TPSMEPPLSGLYVDGMHIYYFLYNILCYRRYFCLFTRPPETSFIQPFSEKQLSARQALKLFWYPDQFD
ncbi:hypothetical protein ACMWDI_16015, partial [Klebsiella pneumoniae]